MFQGFTQESVDFLWGIRFNNERSWFQPRKEEFLELVDRPLRDATPLVAVGDRVHWVIGHGISREAALVPGCKAVELRYEADD